MRRNCDINQMKSDHQRTEKEKKEKESKKKEDSERGRAKAIKGRKRTRTLL